MQQKTIYKIDAIWDDDASVWVATSQDVPGLATEADTMEALAKKLRTIIPELLVANGLVSNQEPFKISFEIISHRLELVNAGS